MSFQVLFGIAIAIALGYISPERATAMKPLGDAFIRLITMIIALIIFCTVVSGIAGMQDLKKVGRVGGKALLYFEVVSTIALVISSQGIFMPLEVALNRLWRFSDDRSYLANQVASFLFAMACGLLALGAAVFSSANVSLLRTVFDNLPVVPQPWKVVVLKLASLPFVTTIILLIYWKLPHGPVRFRTVAPVALWTAVAVEIAHALYLWAWTLLKVRAAYGPFFISVTVLLGGFVGAMIVLAGGEFCARRGRKLAQS